MNCQALNTQALHLGFYADVLDSRLALWEKVSLPRRLWQRDGTLWVADPRQAAATPELADRLGWLTLPSSMIAETENLAAFAAEIKAAGFTHVVLLGMGGSSLAPEVLMTIFGNAAGYPVLQVLDSTHPDAVGALAAGLDIPRTLFLVSSKSGGTIETLSLFNYFFSLAESVLENPGNHFVAITDPGSKLETLALAKQFRRIFSSPQEVGGRYSALTFFGLLPAALIGINVGALLNQTGIMAAACGPGVPAADNPALVLGAALGELALAGRDKVVFLTTPKLASFGVWVEQLVAESTGKRGRGILPVVGEPLADAESYGPDCCFVALQLVGDHQESLAADLDALRQAGLPLISIEVQESISLAQEFYRWEMATAAAGAVLEVNPFDQPNVEAAKSKAREVMAACKTTGSLPIRPPLVQDEYLTVYGLDAAVQPGSVGAVLATFLSRVQPGDYLALMAYLPMFPKNDALLQQLRLLLRRRCQVETTLGYGPRFLHSTGQLHKGDGNRGVFLQLTADGDCDIMIPGQLYTFGVLIAAQAQGDYQALEENGRRLLRIHLSGSPIAGLKQLLALLAAG
ncbi:MAG: glucose-6-phosphate isomerase [Deltaproteobacteria bacterium]|nr:glucose-6-phosphate isomerase [Candidatus Anaeroferrophillus wilburensis]MBN2887760.1 glucose-6-phosphate isomerase [Deltaproteobacteria bacterium]